MSVVDLRKEGDVFILTMQAGENRFNRTFVDEMNRALDEVEKSTGPAALVTIGAEEKFYSNGLDLPWMMNLDKAELNPFVKDVNKLLGRMMGFPVATVAAVNGHAFAAGAMLALAHDFRVMRGDRGFFCLPEVDIHIPIGPGMMALIESRLTPKVFRYSVLTGARVGGFESKEMGIVDEAVPAGEVLPRAIAIAASLANKGRNIYASLKRTMYAEAISLLEGGEVDATGVKF